MAPTALHSDFANRTATVRTYTITQLCEEFGVTARALRFYEDEGLISPQPPGAGAHLQLARPRPPRLDPARQEGRLQPRRDTRDDRPLRRRRRPPEQRRVTLEKCRGRVDPLRKQKVDIDATIDELERFIAMVEAAETADSAAAAE